MQSFVANQAFPASPFKLSWAQPGAAADGFAARHPFISQAPVRGKTAAELGRWAT